MKTTLAYVVACLAVGVSAHGEIPMNPVLGEGGFPSCRQKLRPEQLSPRIEDNIKTLDCTRPAAAEGRIQIGCVGDSITAGAHASDDNHAYPQVLGQYLEAKYPGKYAVTNLGACGSTMQKSGDSPYWQRPQYEGLTGAQWDVVIIMLGTNDAKDPGDNGPNNWQHNCSNPADFSPLDCLFTKDYKAMVDVVRTLGTTSAGPDVYVMIPPPLMQASVYGMNGTVINDVYPNLIPYIAKENGIPDDHVIDIYTALGGTPNWKPSDFPAGGCTVDTRAAAKCPYFCDEQSCDQCHPNNAGYAALAAYVQASIGL